MAYDIFFGIYTPVIISIAFNFTHGAVNNPDGEIFILIGIIILLTVLTIDILIVAKTIKSGTMKRFVKVLIILLFILVRIIGLTVDKNGWRNVIYCFKLKFM